MRPRLYMLLLASVLLAAGTIVYVGTDSADRAGETAVTPAEHARAEHPPHPELEAPRVAPDPGFSDETTGRELLSEPAGGAPPTGSFAVHAVLAGGGDWERSWTLTLAGEPNALGREPFEPRRSERETARVELPGLALAGYRLRAESGSARSRWLAARLSEPGATVAVELLLEPLGVLYGWLTDGLGRPLEGLAITAQTEDGGESIATQSGADGSFELRLLDGRQRLAYGPLESPLIDPEWIEFRGPSLRLEPRTFDRLVELEISVLDEAGRPVMGAHVTSDGPPGGKIDGQTDARGLLLARNLPAGRYRVHAQHALIGRGNESTEVMAPERGPDGTPQPGAKNQVLIKLARLR